MYLICQFVVQVEGCLSPRAQVGDLAKGQLVGQLLELDHVADVLAQAAETESQPKSPSCQFECGGWELHRCLELRVVRKNIPRILKVHDMTGTLQFECSTLSLHYKGCDLQGLDLQGVKYLPKIRVDLPPDRLSKVAIRVDCYH